MENPWTALNTHLASLVEGADAYLVRVDSGSRRTTGVVYKVEATRALVVTAAHVLAGEDTVEIARGDDSGRAAHLVGWDPRTDLALLSTEPAGLTAAPFAPSDDLRAGHMVLTLGRPGRRVRASLGLVAAVGGAWQTAQGADVARYLDVDGRLPDGFSGGVLLDLEGRVTGVNTHALVRGGTTLPTETVQRVVDQLAARGHLPRGHLGVGTQPVALPSEIAASEKQRAGLLVISVEPDSPASRSGLLLGDVLLALGGRRVESHGELVGARDAAAGKSVAARLLRAGTVLEVALEVGEKDGPGPEIPGAGGGCKPKRRGGSCRP